MVAEGVRGEKLGWPLVEKGGHGGADGTMARGEKGLWTRVLNLDGRGVISNTFQHVLLV